MPDIAINRHYAAYQHITYESDESLMEKRRLDVTTRLKIQITGLKYLLPQVCFQVLDIEYRLL